MSPRNIKDLLKMRHAVESIRNRKSTTGANNQEFIQSLKLSSHHPGTQGTGGAGNGNLGNNVGGPSVSIVNGGVQSSQSKPGSIKRTPSNESTNVAASKAGGHSGSALEHQVQK